MREREGERERERETREGAGRGRNWDRVTRRIHEAVFWAPGITGACLVSGKLIGELLGAGLMRLLPRAVTAAPGLLSGPAL